MKRPRIEDFDPNVDSPPTLASPLDAMPEITPRQHWLPQAVGKAVVDEPTPEDRHAQLPRVRTTGPPSVRTLKRHSFEFYLDQLATLKQFSLDEQGRGDKGSMSEIVREALDTYIAKRRRAEE